MTALTVTTADAALKQLYNDDNVAFSAYEDRPLLGMLPKDENFYGRNMPLVNNYGNPAGMSSVFSYAQANSTAAKIEDFVLTRVNEHHVAHLTGEALEAMSNDKGAFIDGMKAQFDGALNALSNLIETYLPRTGTGSLGQISAGSNVATDTVTLANPSDSVNFEVGMSLNGTATDGGAIRTAITAVEVLEAINRRTGQLVATSAAWNTVIAALAAGDYLTLQGDAQAAGTVKVISGLGAWVPATAPTAGVTFFGVDRYLDSRLYGNYYDGSAELIEEALINGQSVGFVEGAKPDVVTLNPVKHRELVKELGSKTQYVRLPAQNSKGAMTEFGYEALQMFGDAGLMKVVSVPKMPKSIAYALTLKTWKLASIGPAIKFNVLDGGGRVLRQAADDGVEGRVVFRGNLGCKKPSGNVHIALSA